MKAKNSKKKVGKKDYMDAAIKPLLIVGGLVAGSFAGKAIDKVMKVDEAEEGVSVKKMAAPVVLLAAGVAGNLFLKDENLKLVATGVTGSGLIKGVKVLLKKDILNGFKGLGDTENPVKQLTIEPYNPELPDLNGEERKFLPIESDMPGAEYEEIGNVTTYVE